MNKIRKGDEVIVLAGRDKGKRGTVAARVDAIRTRITMALGEIRARAMNEHVAIIDALEEGKLPRRNPSCVPIS